MLTSITPSKQMIRKFPPPCSVSLVVLPPTDVDQGVEPHVSRLSHLLTQALMLRAVSQSHLGYRADIGS